MFEQTSAGGAVRSVVERIDINGASVLGTAVQALHRNLAGALLTGTYAAIGVSIAIGAAVVNPKLRHAHQFATLVVCWPMLPLIQPLVRSIFTLYSIGKPSGRVRIVLVLSAVTIVPWRVYLSLVRLSFDLVNTLDIRYQPRRCLPDRHERADRYGASAQSVARRDGGSTLPNRHY